MLGINIVKDMLLFLNKGGPVMWPIILCSIIGLAIIIERLFLFKRIKTDPNDLYKSIVVSISKGNNQAAVEYCNKKNSPVAEVAKSILEGYKNNKDDIDKFVDESIVEEIPKLEKHVGILGIIANIAPLLGLLGTVTGMIKAFMVVSEASLGDPTKLAGGISEALITTAAGLVVGIPTLAAYNYIQIKIDNINWDMEKISTKLINYFKTREISINGE